MIKNIKPTGMTADASIELWNILNCERNGLLERILSVEESMMIIEKRTGMPPSKRSFNQNS